MRISDGIHFFYTAENFLDVLKKQYHAQPLIHFSDLAQFLSHQELAIIFVDQNFYFSEQILSFKKLDDNLKKRMSLVYIDSKFSKQILESEDIFVDKILSPQMPFEVVRNAIQQVVSQLDQRKEIYNLTAQVRSQNKTLQELNENLESLVVQRTQYLEISTHEIETKNRDVKELIRFIKAVSSVNALEDLLLILKQEFLKYHKLNPPLLLYTLRKGVVRLLYFQGPQIIDRVVELDEAHLLDQNHLIQLRKELASVLSRPISGVIGTFLKSSAGYGVLIFEHSMDYLEQKIFNQLLTQRSEPLRVAFDRLILKMKSHEISKQWSTTFDHLQDPIVILDDEYNVIRSNRLFSSNIEEPCYKAFAGRESPCFGCPVYDSRQQQQAHQGKIMAQGKMYQVNAYPIYLESQEKFYNMIVHYTDITHSVNLQSHLIQSEKMSALGLLAGNIAHELNNPLTGIKSLAQLLLGESSPMIQDDLKEIQSAAERSEKIIKNLLEFSSSTPTGNLVSVSAKELIHKTLPFLKSSMRYQNSHIELSELDDQILVEPHLLQQVIFNLVNNACQAMGTSGDLTLQSRVLEDQVEILVRDNGPGIPLELREVIFNPFFTTKREGEGTGLGLSLGRTVIARFGGELLLNSDVSVGSEFIIRLPRVKV